MRPLSSASKFKTPEPPLNQIEVQQNSAEEYDLESPSKSSPLKILFDPAEIQGPSNALPETAMQVYSKKVVREIIKENARKKEEL